MASIKFKAQLVVVGSQKLIVLPSEASAQLPSRGMALISGTINGAVFKSPVEPNGKGSHWLKIDDVLLKTIKANKGDTLIVDVESSKDWPEPELPADLQSALQNDTQAHDKWASITPMARWDWIRWINATAQSDTRLHRIEVGLSKLKHGESRPCCFNRTVCTDPSVCRMGMLLDPTE